MDFSLQSSSVPAWILHKSSLVPVWTIVTVHKCMLGAAWTSQRSSSVPCTVENRVTWDRWVATVFTEFLNDDYLQELFQFKFQNHDVT